MNSLPTAVKQRLGTIATGDAHPDFGVITAFVERSLSSGKRDEVLRHLAGCSRCNELVVLASPEIVPSVPVVTPERHWAPSAFRPWRWITGTALAGALAAAAFWMVQPPTVQHPLPQISAQVSPAPVAPSQTQQIASASTARPRVRKQAAPESSTTAAPAASETAQVAFAPPPPPLVHLGQDAVHVSMESAAPPLSESAVAPVTAAATSTGVVVPSVGPCWRVSRLALLEESLDCANTWTAIALPEPMVVRVVQTFGNNLWVGGNNALLYRSSDSGQHWNKVSVASMSGDVVTIAFGSAMYGWLSTSNGENWITTDGGVTWKRR